MEDEIPKHRSSKNRRKWCKGREGIEHKPVWEGTEYRALMNYTCQTCRKVLDSFFHFPGDTSTNLPEVGSTEPLTRKKNK